MYVYPLKKNRYQRMIAILEFWGFDLTGKSSPCANGLSLVFLDDNLHSTTNTMITLQTEAEVVLARSGI